MTKQIPILFSHDMIQASIDNRKTQTRRTKGLERINICPDDWVLLDLDENTGIAQFQYKQSNVVVSLTCPYGGTGDRLYLKEDHKLIHLYRERKETLQVDYRFNYNDSGSRRFEIYSLDLDIQAKLDSTKSWGKWRSKLLCFKFMSRVWYERTDLKIQRVQDISEWDAKAEGCYSNPAITSTGQDGTDYRRMFQHLWDSINKDRDHGWHRNEWVWAVSFRRIDKV